MKTEDCSKENKDICQPESGEKQMGRREALNKVALTALSTATMMVIMKSQAKAETSTSGIGRPSPNVYIAPSSGSTETWQRTKRS